MKTYIHIRTLVVKGQITRPTHMPFKHIAVPSITWRKITFEGHLLGIVLSGESQPPKVALLMTHLHNRVTKVQKQ